MQNQKYIKFRNETLHNLETKINFKIHLSAEFVVYFSYPFRIHSTMCTQFQIGDLVAAYGDDISVVTDISKSKYGYTSCKVRFLTRPMLEELPEDWFSAPYIKMLVPKTDLKLLIKSVLKDSAAIERLDNQTDDEFCNMVGAKIQEWYKDGPLEKLKTQFKVKT